MERSKQHSGEINEIQSLEIIREMIKVSRNKINQDGILFIVWGWVQLFMNLSGYIQSNMVISFNTEKAIKFLGIALPAAAIAYTLFYIIRQRKKVQTYIGISLRYVWGSLFICMVLVNLIQFNVIKEIIFELQHPIFMVLMAFAVTVTGGILRYRLLIIGGIIFGLLALTASYLELPEQLLIESLAWIIAFIIPGHILFAKRERP
jgi:hypothetical protein